MADPAVFISYRRLDAADPVAKLFERLRDWFGSDQIYYDQARYRPGERFADRLREVLAGAPVTLAVIGPRWLDEINQRCRKDTQYEDLVLEELKLALELQHRCPEQRHVIPVLVDGCSSMPDLDALEPALRSDLAALWAFDVVVLHTDRPDSESGVHALLPRVAGLLGRPPLPRLGDQKRIEEVRQAVLKHLQHPALQPLKTHWADDPLADFRTEDFEALVLAYGGSLVAWQQDRLAPRLGSEQAVEMRRLCRELLALLCGLAVRAWVEWPDADRPVPVASLRALAFVYAAVHGTRVPMSAGSGGSGDFEPEDVMDVGEPDPGGGSRRRAMVHRRLWETIHASPQVPYPTGSQPLAPGSVALNDLRLRWKRRAQFHKRTFILTEQRNAAGSPTDLPDIARELGLVALLRTGHDLGLLHIGEDDFNATVAEILLLIENIT